MTFAFIATLIVTACHKDHNEDEKPEATDATLADSRTVLVYVVAENSLSTFADNDLNEMLRGMSDETLKPGNKLLVYVDDIKRPRIYCITKKCEAQTIDELTPEKQFEDDCNSSSADRLHEIIDYMLTYHKAESYGLVMWSHASGWVPSTFEGDVPRPQRSFGIDNGKNLTYSNIGNQMDIADMARAIEKSCKFDFIFFDACFMQCIEVDYELRNCAKYIVASPAEIPGPGADYSVMMKPMYKANEYAQQMVDTYQTTYYDNATQTYKYVDNVRYGVVISAVDASALEGFATYMKKVCHANLAELQGINPENVLRYFNYDYYNRSNIPDFMDIQGTMKQVLYGVDYDEWQKEFSKVVVANKFTPEWTSIFPIEVKVIPDHCGGVSMFVPIEGRYTKKQGNYVEAVKQTEWGGMMWKE